MVKTVSRTVSLSKEHEKTLQRLAKKNKMSISEFVRKAIDVVDNIDKEGGSV